MNPLICLLIIPFLTLLALLLQKGSRNMWLTSAIGSGVQMLFTFYLTYLFVNARGVGDSSALLFTQSYDWFGPLDIRFSFGIDGISLVMILLTSLVVFTGSLVSKAIRDQEKEFYVLLTLLALGAYGFFISTDLFMLFFFLELAVVPKFLLIGIWGSGRKEDNAMKLALMLMAGSMLVFIGIVGLYFFVGWQTGHYTWNIQEIAQATLPLIQQRVLYLTLFIGFGVFTAMFPFHSWAPDGHSSAPTAASMFLAGVSMKLGGYGCLRVATYLLPDAARELSWIFVILASAAILYGALVTLRQKDMKYMNAFSSISHTGFVLLGIAMLTRASIMGAVMQMVSHGVMTALFFAVIGMIYQRTHTRQMDEMSGVLKQSPFIGSLFIIVGLCSLGLPGMSGFVSEMTLLVGSWERTGLFYRVATILACTSIVITAVYILRAIGKVVWGEVHHRTVAGISDATTSERLVGVLLVAAIFFIGSFPFWITQLLDADSLEIAKRLLASAPM